MSYTRQHARQVSDDQLLSAVVQRYSEYTFVPFLPDLSSLPPGTVLGSYVYTIPAQRLRFYDRSAQAVGAPAGITPLDLAREWLRLAFDLPLRRRRDQRNPAPPVLLAIKTHAPDLVYLDIAGAYRTILEAVGYDVEYKRYRYLSARATRLPPLITRNKRAYAGIVAISSHYYSLLQKIDQEGISSIKVRNIFYQPSLFSVVRDVLSGVYHDVLGLPTLVYANTDGYIVRAPYADLVRHKIEVWGFSVKTKAEGEGEVYGVSSYRVGAMRTNRLGSHNIISPTLGASATYWLRKRFWAAVQRRYDTLG